MALVHAWLYEEVMKYDVGMALVMFRIKAYSVEHACRSYYYLILGYPNPNMTRGMVTF